MSRTRKIFRTGYNSDLLASEITSRITRAKVHSISVPSWRVQRARVEPRACAWYGCCPLGSCRPQILLFPTVRASFAGRYSSAPRLHRKPLPSDDRRDIRETGVTRPIIRSSLATTSSRSVALRISPHRSETITACSRITNTAWARDCFLPRASDSKTTRSSTRRPHRDLPLHICLRQQPA